MFGAVLYGKDDVRYEEREDPKVLEPTDAVVRTVAACVCGSDLWRYRGINEIEGPTPFGHEYVGVVEEVGEAVTGVKPGQFVVGGFTTSDNTCAVCEAGMSSQCENKTGYDGCQAEKIRVQNADGTLIGLDREPDEDLIPALLALSDVMCTGWHAAVSAGVKEGSTVAVIGDGAVGLCAVLAAKQLGASMIVAMSRYPDRQAVARQFGATHVVEERGEAGIEAVRELTGGLGVDCVLECVGTHEAVEQGLETARPGGMVGWVGVPHVGEIDQAHMFWRNVGLRGGVAPVRTYLEDLLARVLDRTLDPGPVFDLTLPLKDVAEAYKAMDERRAIKVMLRP
ncbi:zinc-dependent alcohol dehydrogenase family protein [Arthrobacter sp. UM1]|uniref:zinc-dependent alcohol dehydrogenase family protein n=1 Tax=Arthrobacter sp. UM1 TaxID=2766776 RepID=UPI001CF62872|nr:zinc-dependent alcohol dehydrogenase family protein [Arthrobacter sp. UM1]MCB4208698.1 zinc-dependent alcohol dehydrogenase family protein [Arthrobacter sp. UM1]